MTDKRFDLISYIKSSQVIQGSPETTYGKTLTDGRLESYGDIAKRSRKEINYHLFNGTDFSALSEAHAELTVGKTVNIQARTDSKKINDEFEDLLEEHNHVGNFDVTNFYSRDLGLFSIERFKFINGGVIIRHHFNIAWKIPYKVELVGVDMIDTSKSFYLQNIRNGIQTDRYGAIVGLYLFDDYEKTMSTLHSTEDMTFYATRWMSLSQYTAVSRLATILQDYDGLKIYNTEEVKAAIERAKSGVYWHTELFAELQEALSLKMKTYDTDQRVVEARDLINSLSRRGIGVTGATATPKEDTITQVDTKTDSIYGVFANEGQKKMASSVGMSQTAAYKDPTKGNYSSLKLMVSLDDNHFGTVFEGLTKSVIQTYNETLFRVGVQIGRISAPKITYFANPRKFHKWDILRTVKINIDESKEATATAKNLEAKTTTLQRVYAQKGLDYMTEQEKQIDLDIQLKLLEKEKYEKAGLPYPEIATEAPKLKKGKNNVL